MSNNHIFLESPFNGFPYKTFPQMIDKLEYLGRNEEHSPYEISPSTDLCISDVYYSLGFLTYLHSYGRVIEEVPKWVLKPKGKKQLKKPHRFATIANSSLILEELSKNPITVQDIHKATPELTEEQISNYLHILSLITQKGKVEQKAEGWDATYVLIDW
ncbi:MAG: hypothetical protein KAT16_04720 [Candidatus Heimdallarchaeota archaeon]|nr:hypothetical protein [Candidatus Heimdallarchaeota archaeon]